MNMKIEEKLIILRNFFYISGGLILLVTLIFQGLQCYFAFGKQQLQVANEFESFAKKSDMDYSEVLWDGDVYAYNEDLINLLILGVDGRGVAEKNENYGFGPRADSIYLATINPNRASIKLINISRDAMTDIRMYDSIGQDMGILSAQLGLQYCNGDGLEGSCQLMESAVSHLLNEIPIHGYLALYWNGISEIHDEIGPVIVEVPEYLQRLDPVNFTKSGTIELNAQQAKIFVQCRDITVTGSDELRRERQEEYFQALYLSAKEKMQNNLLSVLSIKERIDPYLVTDLKIHEILTLTNWVRQWDLKKLFIESVPGKTVDTMFQDEYVVDQGKLQRMIIRNFYLKRY